MKVGIVVPFSWSYWGGVNEHAHQQAQALMALGHDVRIVIGNDPPGRLTRMLHPRVGSHEPPPSYVIPVGRSVIVPANGTLPNIVLSPSAMARVKRVWARERFDVVHVHEPYAPLLSSFALATAPSPTVVTCHSSGGRWWPVGRVLWGIVCERIDHRLAVSEQALRAAAPYIPGPFEILPNGVALPESPDPGHRSRDVVFVGRQDPRKGLEHLLRAWPAIRSVTGGRLRVIGADPLSVRFLSRRKGLDRERVDVLGTISEEALTEELSRASVLVAPSVGRESFGMVLTRAFACATPVVASDIDGYKEVVEPGTGILVRPADADAIAAAVLGLVEDEPRRRAMGEAARRTAEQRYAWPRIAERLADIYAGLVGTPAAVRVAAR
jgi:phosphatidyl-myo-inositol alpha-mannosyltransferase